jgi:hypothetical protein
MGYPPEFKIPVSDTQAYKQFGNSVVVPVVERIAKAVVETLRRPIDYRPPLILMENDKGNTKRPMRENVPASYRKRKSPQKA